MKYLPILLLLFSMGSTAKEPVIGWMVHTPLPLHFWGVTMLDKPFPAPTFPAPIYYATEDDCKRVLNGLTREGEVRTGFCVRVIVP